MKLKNVLIVVKDTERSKKFYDSTSATPDYSKRMDQWFIIVNGFFVFLFLCIIKTIQAAQSCCAAPFFAVKSCIIKLGL